MDVVVDGDDDSMIPETVPSVLVSNRMNAAYAQDFLIWKPDLYRGLLFSPVADVA